MHGKASGIQILSIGFLIVGNLIGAGILALPINTGLAGFVPSFLGLLVTSIAMFYSAIILSREAVFHQDKTFNYPSLYQIYLGTAGKWVAVVANLIILWGLLTAYLTGITTIVTNLFDLSVAPVWIMLGFFGIVTLISMAGMLRLEKYIAVLVLLKCLVFVVIAVMAGTHINAENLAHHNWPLFIAGIPILVTAFHFHNIIPAICETLKWDIKLITRTMLIGMVLGFLMNATWLMIGIGVLPLDNSPIGLINAFMKNLPATIPMAEAIGSQIFLVCAMFFAMVAITTAYLANGLGLIGFMDDLTKHQFGKSSPMLSRVLSFGPPLLIALVYPDVFLKAIDFAGGFGIVVLFGILPSIIAIRKAQSSGQRLLGYAMLLLFGCFFMLEVAQEVGLLHIPVSAEYWNDQGAR